MAGWKASICIAGNLNTITNRDIKLVWLFLLPMKTERVFVCLFVIAYAMKFLHMGEAGLLMLLVTGVLSLLYLLGGFYFFSDESIKRQNLVFSIIAGILLALVPQAILQKVQYWADAQLYLLVGIGASLLIFIIAFVLRNRKQELLQYYRNMLYRSGTLLGLCILLFIIPTGTLVHWQYWDNKEFADIATNFYLHPDNKTYEKQYNEYRATHSPTGRLLKGDMLKK